MYAGFDAVSMANPDTFPCSPVRRDEPSRTVERLFRGAWGGVGIASKRIDDSPADQARPRKKGKRSNPLFPGGILQASIGLEILEVFVLHGNHAIRPDLASARLCPFARTLLGRGCEIRSIFIEPVQSRLLRSRRIGKDL